MVIAIWGRDGIGKSTLCDGLAELFAQQGVTLVIDTDLTQPTVPTRIQRAGLDAETSLGKAISGIDVTDVTRYWHQHPRHKSLFYAGLTEHDGYLTHELALEDRESAVAFLEESLEVADTVILDLSGQRADPFLIGGLTFSDRALIAFPPNLQGIYWFNGIKPLLELLQAQHSVLPIALPLIQPCDEALVEKATDAQFAALLPYAHEHYRMREAGTSPLNGTTPSAIRYARSVRRLYDAIKEGSEE